MICDIIGARHTDHASRNDWWRKSNEPIPARAGTEAAIRALIRQEFRGIAKYCPRQFRRIAPGIVVQLMQCRREHSASIRREFGR